MGIAKPCLGIPNMIILYVFKLLLSSVITQNPFLWAVHNGDQSLEEFSGIYVKVRENLCKGL